MSRMDSIYMCWHLFHFGKIQVDSLNKMSLLPMADTDLLGKVYKIPDPLILDNYHVDMAYSRLHLSSSSGMFLLDMEDICYILAAGKDTLRVYNRCCYSMFYFR